MTATQLKVHANLSFENTEIGRRFVNYLSSILATVRDIRLMLSFDSFHDTAMRV